VVGPLAAEWSRRVVVTSSIRQGRSMPQVSLTEFDAALAGLGSIREASPRRPHRPGKP
jgi:hypothetical protein